RRDAHGQFQRVVGQRADAAIEAVDAEIGKLAALNWQTLPGFAHHALKLFGFAARFRPAERKDQFAAVALEAPDVDLERVGPGAARHARDAHAVRAVGCQL